MLNISEFQREVEPVKEFTILSDIFKLIIYCGEVKFDRLLQDKGTTTSIAERNFSRFVCFYAVVSL